MEKIKEILSNQVNSENLNVLEIDCSSDEKLKGHIQGRFPEAFEAGGNNFDEYLNIIRENGGYEVEVLVRYHDKESDKIIYFDQHIDKSTIKGMLSNLSSQDSFKIHIGGKDAREVLEKIQCYSKLVSQKQEEKEKELTSYKATFDIINESGMHARPCSSFIQKANQFSSEVKLRKVGEEEYHNGKSMIHLIMLGATKGSRLELLVEGDDAQKAGESLYHFVLNEESFIKV